MHKITVIFILLAFAASPRSAPSKDPYGPRDATTFTIPLRVDAHTDLKTPAGWPVTAGVPFAPGQLTEVQFKDLRVQNQDGTSVPCQFEVRGRYPTTKDVRWLGVFWQLQPGASYQLIKAAKPAPLHKPAGAVLTTDSEEEITLASAGMKAHFPKTGGFLSKVTLNGKSLIKESSTTGNWLVTLQGAHHQEADVKVKLERKGPLVATVYSTGWYHDAAGKPSCRWEARTHAFAGRPELQIVHKFVWIGTHDKLQIKDLALSFGLSNAPAEVAVDRSAELSDSPFTTPLPKQQMVALLQDEHYHWGHGNSHYAIETGTLKAPQTEVTGKRAGNWMQVRSPNGAVTLALRDFWQRFPKELRAESGSSADSGQAGKLTAFLWSTRGKALPFDLREENLKTFWGPIAAASRETAMVKPQYKTVFQDPYQMDPTGMARTHDMLLRFDAGPADPNRLAQTFNTPPVATADAEWIEQSNVLKYKFGARDPERFKDLDAKEDEAWKDVIQKTDYWGDYGFLYYGQGPHATWRRDPKTRKINASQLMYGQTHPLPFWISYLRTGKRAHFEKARNHVRFYQDLEYCHHTGKGMMKGDFAWFGRRGSMPWSGLQRQFLKNSPIPAKWPNTGLYVTSEFLPLHYYLTGERFALETVQAMAALTKEYIELMPDWAEKLVSGAEKRQQFYASLWKAHALKVGDLAMFYEVTEDPFFMDQATRRLKALTGTSHPSTLLAVPDERNGEAHYTGYTRYAQRYFLKFLNVAEHSGRSKAANLARKAMMGIAEEQRVQNFASWGGNPPLMGFAWEQTGHADYVQLGLQRLMRSYGGFRYTPQGSPMSSVNLSDVFRGIPGITWGLKRVRDLPTHSPVVYKPERCTRPMTLVFRKPQGQTVNLELTMHSTKLKGPKGQPWKKEWLGQPVLWHPSKVAVMYVHKIPIQHYRAVKIPADAPPGEYEIEVPEKGFAAILRTDAAHVVAVAPEGLHMAGGTHPGWYFKVPPAGGTLKCSGLGAQNLKVKDPQNKPRHRKTKSGRGNDETSTFTLPAGELQLWRLVGEGYHQIKFEGIEPVFALGDPSRFFIPESLKP